MIIYAITNRVNGKRYIGMTEHTSAYRWGQHRKAARNSVETALYNAMRRYGLEQFDHEALAYVIPGMGRDALCELERIIIEQEGALSPGGYNMTAGGDGVPKGHKASRPNRNRGTSWTEARREAWLHPDVARATVKKPERQCLAKRPPTPEELSAKRSEIIRRLWAEKPEVMRSGPKTPEFLAALAERNRTRNVTPEARAKVSAAWTPERRAAKAKWMAEYNRRDKERIAA